MKAESFAKDYTDTVILFNGDSILIVDDWKNLRSLGPSSYKRDVKIVTTFVEEMREFCSLPCTISDDFDMSTWMSMTRVHILKPLRVCMDKHTPSHGPARPAPVGV